MKGKSDDDEREDPCFAHAGSSDEEIGEWMSGNLCRCAAYPNIRAAIRAVRDAEGGKGHAAD